MASETIIKTLENQGWSKRFVAAEPRLSEAVEIYREAGFEVHLEPLPPQEKPSEGQMCKTDGDCRACFEGFEDRYKIIFTRPHKNGGD